SYTITHHPPTPTANHPLSLHDALPIYENGPAISAQILIYPVTQLSYDTPSYEQFKEGYGLDKNLMIWFVEHYIRNDADRDNPYRSEEHTSELQSRFDLVCRLLLEKKKE